MVEEIKKANIDEGAKEVAGLLDKGRVDDVADRLREDWARMTPQEFGTLLRDINKHDNKGTGWDLSIHDGSVTADDKTSRLRTAFGWNEHKRLGMYSARAGVDTFVPQAPSPRLGDGAAHIGAGFADAADRRAAEDAKAHQQAMNERVKKFPELRK